MKEAIGHIRGNGYHFGKAPYGSKAVPSPDNPRYRILVDDPEEQHSVSDQVDDRSAGELPEDRDTTERRASTASTGRIVDGVCDL